MLKRRIYKRLFENMRVVIYDVDENVNFRVITNIFEYYFFERCIQYVKIKRNPFKNKVDIYLKFRKLYIRDISDTKFYFEFLEKPSHLVKIYGKIHRLKKLI